jgi:hypothetical protein
LFRNYGLLVDATSIFIVLSTVLGSLIASALSEIESAEKQAAENEMRLKIDEAYRAGEQAAAQSSVVRPTESDHD